MTIVSSKLKLLDRGRQRIQDAGLRPTRVYIRTRTFDSGVTGKGAYADADVEITPRPCVAEVEGVIGIGKGRFVIDGITPDYGTGGWLPSDLAPTQPAGSRVYLVLDGPMGKMRECKIVDVDVRRAFGFKVYCEDLT